MSWNDLLKFGASFAIVLCVFLLQKIFVRAKQRRVAVTKEALRDTLLRSMELTSKFENKLGPQSKQQPNLHSNNDDRDVDFFFYFTNEVDAKRAANKLAAWGFKPKTDKQAGQVSVTCTHQMSFDMDLIKALEDKFNELARDNHGEFDGFGTELKD